MKYTIVQGHPRGFLSTYITILTSFRHFNKNKIDMNDIYIDENIFSLYGKIDNWFNYSRITSDIIGESFNSMTSHKKEEWTPKELASSETDLPFKLLNQYNLLPFNNRIAEKLNVSNFDNTLGIHYRGTDHQGYHTIPVSIQTYLIFIEKLLNSGKYDKVFLASDEQKSFDRIVNYIDSKFKIKIIYNNFYRSNNNTPIHFTKIDPLKKIQTADEVLIDATMLSKCSKVIARHSNIINYAWTINPILNVTYLDGSFKHV